MTMRYARVPRFGLDDHRGVREPVALLRTRNDLRGQVQSDRMFRMWLLAALNFLDLVTTAVVLALGGAEGNPILSPLMSNWWTPLGMKAVALWILWIVVRRCPFDSPRADYILQAGSVFYAGVVLWNLTLILTH